MYSIKRIISFETEKCCMHTLYHGVKLCKHQQYKAKKHLVLSLFTGTQEVISKNKTVHHSEVMIPKLVNEKIYKNNSFVNKCQMS